MPRDFGTGEPRGFAFVRFLDKRDAEDAMDAMEGKLIDGREIRIQFAKRKRPDDPKAHFATIGGDRYRSDGYRGG